MMFESHPALLSLSAVLLDSSFFRSLMLEPKWEKLGMEAQSPVAFLEQRSRACVAHEMCGSLGEWSATWDCSLLTGQHPFALSPLHGGLGKEINMLVLRQKNYIKSFPPLLNSTFPFLSDVGRVSKTPKELLFFL